MAQGAPKKASGPTLKSKPKSKVTGPRPGAKVIKPKKAKLLAKAKLLKKHSAGMTARTEKNLAERAGHLEIIKGGKKDKKDKKEKESGKKG